MKQARVLSEAEFRRAIVACSIGRHAARNRLSLMLSHYAGLRVGEISHLKVGDVLAEDGSVRDRVHLNPTYTNGGVSRTVFLNAKLSKELARYVDGLSGLPARLSGREAPLLRSQKGGAFSPNSLCQLFSKLYARCGIDGASSHSGRRAFITRLAHSGVSPKVIMELVGHKHLTTTQRYIEVDDEMKKAAVELLR